MLDREGYPALKQGVRLVVEERSAGALQLTAVVESVTPDGHLRLRCMDAAKATTLQTGAVVTLEYFRHGTVYKMRSAVAQVEAAKAAPASVLVTATPRDVKKVQRRRYPRALVSAALSFVTIELSPKFDKKSWAGRRTVSQWAKDLGERGFKATTETVSGSGLRLRTAGHVNKGEHLFIQLQLSDTTIALVGKVVWIGSGTPRESPGEAAGVEFVAITDEDRKKIVEFISSAVPAPEG